MVNFIGMFSVTVWRTFGSHPEKYKHNPSPLLLFFKVICLCKRPPLSTHFPLCFHWQECWQLNDWVQRLCFLHTSANIWTFQSQAEFVLLFLVNCGWTKIPHVKPCNKIWWCGYFVSILLDVGCRIQVGVLLCSIWFSLVFNLIVCSKSDQLLPHLLNSKTAPLGHSSPSSYPVLSFWTETFSFSVTIQFSVFCLLAQQ